MVADKEFKLSGFQQETIDSILRMEEKSWPFGEDFGLIN